MKSKKGEIKFVDIMAVLPSKFEFGFNVISRNSRVYQLQATGNDEVSQWKYCFENLKLKPKK
jgi:hypothetical protein